MPELDEMLNNLYKAAAGDKDGQSAYAPVADPAPQSSPDAASPLMPMLGSLFGGDSSGIFSLLSGLLGAGGGDDDATRLLTSLRPFMNEKRAPNIDTAIRAAQVARLARGFTQNKSGAGSGDK